MSKTQFTVVTDKSSAIPANHVRKTYKYFDLDTFEDKSETIDIPFTSAKDLAEAQARVGGDESTLLKALNAFLKGEALKDGENSVTSKGGKRSVVLAVAKPFRAMPPFDKVFKLDADGKPVVENGEKVIDRKEQTKKILDMIKASPAMLQSIKDASLVSTDDEESEEVENDE
jgi:hypothetical protein